MCRNGHAGSASVRIVQKNTFEAQILWKMKCITVRTDWN